MKNHLLQWCLSTEGRKSMLKLAERMVMSFCSGVKHPMTQKQRGGNHGVSAITEIWYLILTFSFSLQSSKQTLCHLLCVFLFYFFSQNWRGVLNDLPTNSGVNWHCWHLHRHCVVAGRWSTSLAASTQSTSRPVLRRSNREMTAPKVQSCWPTYMVQTLGYAFTRYIVVHA